MSGKQLFLIGCGGLVVFGGILIVGLLAFVFHVSQDVPEVAISVDAPIDAVVGEPFSLVVKVTNERTQRPVELSNIDVSDECLSGFTLVAADPPAKSTSQNPFDDTRTFTFEVSIPPGETMAFTFQLRPERPGIYRGDIDAYEGMRFITTMAQTVVKEKQ